jgi:tRNA(His) 5'-end guanylyltransferase
VEINSLGDRMKEYETVSHINLMRRTPVIIRLDGKAFHTYSRQSIFKNEEQPFSDTLHESLTIAAMKMLKNIQGSRFAYIQSDEISILLTDWKKLNTDAWFKYNIQKITSISASLLTYYFNDHVNVSCKYENKIPALFDSRVFNLPLNEVTNYFIWRQQDATKNSINMLSKEHFSDKQLYKKNISERQNMLMSKNINWNDIPIKFKRGSSIESHYIDDRLIYEINYEIPIFTQNRKYIEDYIY